MVEGIDTIHTGPPLFRRSLTLKPKRASFNAPEYDVAPHNQKSLIELLSTTAMLTYAIPGLHQQPTYADLQSSSDIYNHLITDREQPSVPEHHLKILAQLFVQHGVQDMFGLHLIHAHFRIPPNTIMLGSMFRRELSGYWTRPTSFDIGLSDLFHGHIFTLSAENQFLPYEYRRGELCKRVLETDNAFFQALSSYLRAHKLTGILALEILEHTANASSHMWEFVLGEQGTVQVHEDNRVAQTSTYRVTGWSFAQDEDGTVSVKGHETHASIGNCGHQIFTDGKAMRKIDDVLDLLLHEGRSNNSSKNGPSNESFVLNDVV